MSRLVRSVVVVLMLTASLSVDAQPINTAGAAMWLAVFEAYPGAQAHCTQHVSGAGMHIQWTMYVSTDAPANVAAFYGIEVGETRDGDDDRKLSVHDAKRGGFPTCDVPLEPTTRTVLIVSRATR